MEKCFICGKDTEYECRDCGGFVCDDYTMPYNQFTQIDYTLCTVCGGIHNDERADEDLRSKQRDEQELKNREIRNERQRKYYHSEKAVEKRRLKKIEQQRIAAERSIAIAKRMAEILNEIFK